MLVWTHHQNIALKLALIIIGYTSADMRVTRIRAVSNPNGLWRMRMGETPRTRYYLGLFQICVHTHRVRVGRHVCARGVINCIWLQHTHTHTMQLPGRWERLLKSSVVLTCADVFPSFRSLGQIIYWHILRAAPTACYTRESASLNSYLITGPSYSLVNIYPSQLFLCDLHALTRFTSNQMVF